MIDESEIDDFEKAVKERGLAPGDFEVFEVPERRAAPFPGSVWDAGRVTVRFKNTGVTRTYRAGDNGTSWPADFEEDLRAGAFTRLRARSPHGARQPVYWRS